jgi:hypothetical protein
MKITKNFLLKEQEIMKNTTQSEILIRVKGRKDGGYEADDRDDGKIVEYTSDDTDSFLNMLSFYPEDELLNSNSNYNKEDAIEDVKNGWTIKFRINSEDWKDLLDIFRAS